MYGPFDLRREQMGNAETVQGIYEAFGRGDIPAIMERMSETVEWD